MPYLFFLNLEHIRWRKLMPPGHSTSLQTRTVWDKKIQKVGEKSQVLSAPFGSWLVCFINRPRTINLCFPERKGHIPDFNVSNSPQKPNKSMQNPPSIPKANWPLARNKNGYLGDSGSFHFGWFFVALCTGAKLLSFLRFRDPKTKAKRYQGVRFPTTWSLRIPSSLVFFSGRGIFLRLVRMGWLIWRIPSPKKKCKNFSQLKVKKGGFDLENAGKSWE